MIRLPGILKVLAVLTVDCLSVYVLLHDTAIAAVVTSVIVLYVWLGGYLALFREGAIRGENLPNYERSRLETAKYQLAEEVKSISSVDISGLKIYLIDGDCDMQATAYGANCVSVSKGTFENTDLITLNAVLGHEISHILNLDAEFNRAVFATILLVCIAISFVSFASIATVFLLFLICNCFRSWIGIMAYKGTSKFMGGFFSLFQKGVVVIYRVVSSCMNRNAEFRADCYSAQLGYGVQLAHFLSYAAPESHRQLTIAEALYRTHPSTPKRIARLESHANSGKHLVIK